MYPKRYKKGSPEKPQIDLFAIESIQITRKQQGFKRTV